MHESDTIWDDMNPDQLETLPDTQIHRNVDLMVLAADKEGVFTTFSNPFITQRNSLICARVRTDAHRPSIYDLRLRHR
jgi:hypothetical protein